jgi:hypothetical protein
MKTKVTQQQNLQNLDWLLRDIADALKSSLESGNMDGVIKYAQQAKLVQHQIALASKVGRTRAQRREGIFCFRGTAGSQFGRGKLP